MVWCPWQQPISGSKEERLWRETFWNRDGASKWGQVKQAKT